MAAHAAKHQLVLVGHGAFRPFRNVWMLEELGVPYTTTRIDLSNKEQFDPAFVAINPNAKIPAIVDHAACGGNGEQVVFESGAILHYLAERTGRLLPSDDAGRWDAISWLYWQMGNLGPMSE